MTSCVPLTKNAYLFSPYWKGLHFFPLTNRPICVSVTKYVSFCPRYQICLLLSPLAKRPICVSVNELAYLCSCYAICLHLSPLPNTYLCSCYAICLHLSPLPNTYFFQTLFKVSLALENNNMFSWVVTLCRLVSDYQNSEERTTSVFKVLWINTCIPWRWG